MSRHFREIRQHKHTQERILQVLLLLLETIIISMNLPYNRRSPKNVINDHFIRKSPPFFNWYSYFYCSCCCLFSLAFAASRNSIEPLYLRLAFASICSIFSSIIKQSCRRRRQNSICELFYMYFNGNLKFNGQASCATITWLMVADYQARWFIALRSLVRLFVCSIG